MTTLLYDIDRCPGVPNLPDEPPGWREGCETCLRRTAPGSPRLPRASGDRPSVVQVRHPMTLVAPCERG